MLEDKGTLMDVEIMGMGITQLAATERLARLEASLEGHEASCLSFQRITFIIVGIVAVSIGGMFTQLMLTVGAQSAAVRELSNHDQGIRDISAQIRTSENRIWNDIADLRKAITTK